MDCLSSAASLYFKKGGYAKVKILSYGGYINLFLRIQTIAYSIQNESKLARWIYFFECIVAQCFDILEIYGYIVYWDIDNM